MRPRILDVYCGAGGVTRGLVQAGFDVVGLDLNPQPRYPGPIIRADALAQDKRFLRSFDAIWASPPCQFGTTLSHAPHAKEHANLIPATRAMLEASGLPWVIENVDAPKVRPHMRGAVTLCGSHFNLGAQGHQLRRHRLFLSNFPIPQPTCSHTEPVIGIYGGHARRRSAKHGGRGTRDVWTGGHLAAASEAMDISWMTLDEISEAIPPAYSLFVGLALLDHLTQRREVA